MSYRIWVGIVKKKDLEVHLSQEFTDSDEDYDKKWDFLHNLTKIELNDNTPIEQFKVIKGYEDEEYPPYVLTKKDFQKLLNYYKKFLTESFKEKEKEVRENKYKDNSLSYERHIYHIKIYFDRLIKENKNIDSSGLFLLDYFYLVRMYENWKNGDRAIITHG